MRDEPQASVVALTARRPVGHESLGRLLVRRGVLDETGLARAMALQRESGRRLGDILVAERMVTADDVVAALGEQLGIPALRSSDRMQPDPSALALLAPEDAFRLRALPIAILADDRLSVAMADPLDLVARDDLAKLTGRRIAPAVANEDSLMAAIQLAYLASSPQFAELGEVEPSSAEETADINLNDLVAQANDEPIVKLVNSLISKAIQDRASDIHFEPQRQKLLVRHRLDGLLYPLATLARDVAPAALSRIKILANMDIAERRLPQDGRFTVTLGGAEFDVRVSSLPGIYGESIVLRILYKDAVGFGFEELGFAPAAQEMLRRQMHRSQGALLLTGPTGSGKTTTLYACLAEIDRARLKVITLEDPVEYHLAGINQVQVNAKIGLTFAAGLRSVLRQDPDVVMVGEIRDRETAELAVRASLTGHLVLSTLHTNDAIGTVTRLVNMGIEPYLLTESLSLIGAQRLLRTVCPSCSAPYEPEPGALALLRIAPGAGSFRRGLGCPACHGIGYRGRIGILELVEMTADLRGRIIDGGHGQRLREAALAAGTVPLLDVAVDKAKAGVTTIEEVLRVCAVDG